MTLDTASSEDSPGSGKEFVEAAGSTRSYLADIGFRLGFTKPKEASVSPRD
jgi:hypothetical protein